MAKSRCATDQVKAFGARRGAVVSAPWPSCKNLELIKFSTGLSRRALPEKELVSTLSDTSYLRLDAPSTAQRTDSIPAELCTRELLELDPEDEPSAFEFMRRFGAVTAPYYGSGFHPLPSAPARQKKGEAADALLAERLIQIRHELVDASAPAQISKTDGFELLLRDPIWKSGAIRAELASNGESDARVASWDESFTALMLLKESVAIMAALDIAEGSCEEAAAILQEKNIPLCYVEGDAGRYQLRDYKEGDGRSRRRMTELTVRRKVYDAFLYLNKMAFCTGDLIFTGLRAFRSAENVDAPSRNAIESYIQESDISSEYVKQLLRAPYESEETQLPRTDDSLDSLMHQAPHMEGSLGAAIALQLFGIIEDPRPWRQCEEKTCGRHFKAYRHYKPQPVHDAKRIKNARFCSGACQEKKKRSQRKEALEELENAVCEHERFIENLPPEKQIQWLRNAARDICLRPRFVSVKDRSSVEKHGENAELRYPIIKERDVLAALKRLQSQTE